MILGPIIGSCKLAVAGYMSTVGVPHLNTGPAPWPATMQEWCFLGCGSECQFATVMGVHAYEKLGYRTVTAMSNELVHGRGFIASFKQPFESRGGKMIQEQYASFPCTDYAPYLANLKDADALVAWYDGADSILFLTQVHEYGVRKRMPLVAAFFGSFFAPFILNAMPPEAADAIIGEYCPTPYTPFLETEVNKKFVEAFKKKFGETPFETDSGPYDGALMALEALKATGGDTTPEKLRQALLEIEMEGVQGFVSFDPATRCRVRDIYVIKMDKIDGEYTWVPVYTYEDVPPPGLAPPPGPPPGH